MSSLRRRPSVSDGHPTPQMNTAGPGSRAVPSGLRGLAKRPRLLIRALRTFLSFLPTLGLCFVLSKVFWAEKPATKFPAAEEAMAAGDRLSLLFPICEKDVNKIESVLDSWGAFPQACSGMYRSNMDFFFLYNRLPDAVVDRLKQKLATSAAYKHISGCFSRTGIAYANLTDLEDEYPAGPSNMFFKLIESDDLKPFRSQFKYIFWAESDVEPIRPMWADALFIEATLPTSYNGAAPDWWMKGSMYRGRGFDASALYPSNWAWIDHINGNSLYRMNEPEFEDFVRITKEYENPNDYWKPFDIAMTRVLNSNPYGWVMRQYAARKFVSSDFVQHFGFVSDQASSSALSNPRTSFVHGKPGSAGDVAYRAKFDDLGRPLLRDVPEEENTGAIRKGHQMCVLLRTFADDLEYASMAVQSAIKHIPNFNELVIVVPTKDVANATKMFPNAASQRIKIVGEEDLLDSGHMQQKYTKLHADQYCPKETRYVFHLDSDVVLTRTLTIRDVFFRGKPMLQYAPYSALDPGDRQWKEGTSAAVKKDVEHEFSRSNSHVYPIEVYPRLRKFLETTHKMRLLDFLRSKHGRFHGGERNATTYQNLFSDFNAIGAYLYYYEPDLVTFVPFYDTNPLIISRFADTFPIIPRLTCQGNARLNLEPTMLAKGLSLKDREFAALKRAMDGGWDAGCWEVLALAAEMKKRVEAAKTANKEAGSKQQ